MSKKKINNRLNRLFEDINKEPEANQTPDLGKSSPQANKGYSPVFFQSTTGEALDPVQDVVFPPNTDKPDVLKNIYQTPSTLLSAAFRTDERNWATLKVVDESKQRTWGAEEQTLVKQVVDQLSLALENARLFQEAQRRAREMTALADVAREISATLELQQVMERISNQASLILDAATSAVYVPDPQFQTLIAITATGENADEIKTDTFKVGEGILGKIALNKVAQIVNDMPINPNALTITETEKQRHNHLMAAPIQSQNQLNGLLAVWRIGKAEQFSETELEFLTSLAQQAAIAVENVRLFEETQERAEELSVLNEMARELSAEMNINSIAETAYRYINRLIDTTNFYIALFEEQNNLIHFPVFIEESVRISVPSRKPANGLTEYVIRTKEALFLANDVNKQINSMELEGVLVGNKESALCWLGVPLLVGNKPIGAMTVQSFDSPNIYGEHDKELMMTVASQVAIAMENARLFNDAQARARREKILREITARIRATNDPEMIAKAAVRELGQALGVPTFIRLGGNEVTSSQEAEIGKANNKSDEISEGDD
jgi:GAF domain-containing protein